MIKVNLLDWALEKKRARESNLDPKETVNTVQAANLAIAILIILGLSFIGIRCWSQKDVSLSVLTGIHHMTLFSPTATSLSDRWMAADKATWLEILDLKRLPIDLQQTLARLLLLPLGALITAVCRNIIGFTTFGTFVPPLLALALVLTNWKIGSILILTILLLGIGIRTSIDPLKLLMIPRLGTVLTVAVLFLVFSISAVNYFDPNTSQQMVLLPVVILTGLIERLFITLEEQGTTHTMQRLVGTILVGCSCYALLSSRELGEWVLSYPEVHCWTLAGMVGIGRYSGYRVSELFRFGDLTESMAAPPGSISFPVQPTATASALQTHPPIFSKEAQTQKLPNTEIENVLEKAVEKPIATGIDGSGNLAPPNSRNAPKPLSFIWPDRLKKLGIVGINRRNADYVLPHNPRKDYPIVDNKVLTKQICLQQDIPVPETYAVIKHFGDIQRLPELLAGRTDFAIKPARGSGGRGILVIARKTDGIFEKPDGTKITPAQMRYHLSGILSGLHSLGGESDEVIIEQRIAQPEAFEAISVGGTPDIRVILFRGVPVMAMTRLPTQASGGRANLHQGAIATGIDLLSGKTSGGVCQNRTVWVHPDTGHSLEGFQIPHWDTILARSIRLGNSLNLDYIGVDLVVDANLGPVVLDVNARPGLAIQVANRCGLQRRLEFIAAQPPQMLAPERCLELIPHLSRLM